MNKRVIAECKAMSNERLAFKVSVSENKGETMEIRLYATLRPIVGRSTVTLDTSTGDTVRSMLDELVTRWPALKPKLFIKLIAAHAFGARLNGTRKLCEIPG